MVLIHTLTPDSTTDMLDTTLVTHTLTTARDLLMPSPRLMLMPTMVSMAMDWVTTDWDTELTDTPTARGPLTPSLRLMPMPTMATMAMAPDPTTDTDTDTEDTEDTTTDKFSGPEVQSKSSKRTSLL